MIKRLKDHRDILETDERDESVFLRGKIVDVRSSVRPKQPMKKETLFISMTVSLFFSCKQNFSTL